VALAWVLAQGGDITAIPGTKRRKYLEQNAGASEIKLSAEDLNILSSIGQAAGPRYADMSTIDA
jgi:aryl-alcohol dehydrogenase-like predicted oxidoreductase